MVRILLGASVLQWLDLTWRNSPTRRLHVSPVNFLEAVLSGAGVFLDESVTIVLDGGDLLSAVCGSNDGNLKIIEGSLGGRVVVRGNEVRMDGLDETGTERFKLIMDNLIASAREGESPSPDFVKALTDTEVTGENGKSPIRSSQIVIPHGFSKVFARSKNQADYINGIRECDICFCLGPAGTGKTYLAIACALSLVLSKKVRKLVLTRPVVEAGESLGFLPGDLAQKINPYLRPLYDAMESLIPFNMVAKMEETRQIEIAPLAYMRGRSLNDAFIILDEAQNTTKEQMKMFLTRLGNGSQAVITGDTTQIDLPKRVDSGLLHAVSLLSSVQGIHFAYLNTADVVRHPLIKKIIQAYENEKK
ncbi:phosphate starvation protein PhoH [Spirochaetia bacterium]|nr:phosphate starvation protein PhoH [Spirochaetia bacterium]